MQMLLIVTRSMFCHAPRALRLSLGAAAVFSLVACSSASAHSKPNDQGEIGTNSVNGVPDGNRVPTRIQTVLGAPFKITACDAVATRNLDASGNEVPRLWLRTQLQNT